SGRPSRRRRLCSRPPQLGQACARSAQASYPRRYVEPLEVLRRLSCSIPPLVCSLAPPGRETRSGVQRDEHRGCPTRSRRERLNQITSTALQRLGGPLGKTATHRCSLRIAP